MCRVAKVRDLIACSRLEPERSAITKFAVQLPFEYKQDMTSITPMISEVTRGILDHPHAQIAIDLAPP